MDSSRYFPDHLHIEPGVVAEFAIITGLVICLYGFRLLRTMIFVCGVLVTGLFVSVAVENAFGLKSWVLAASWIGGFVIGIAGGCVALAFFPLGVFVLGSMLAYTFTSSLPYRVFPGESSYVLDGAVVLIGGILAWLLVRPFTIVASSLVGSVTAIWGVGYFAGKYPSGDDIERFHSHLTGRGTWSEWSNSVAMLAKRVVAATLVTTLAGDPVQTLSYAEFDAEKRATQSTGR
ncbi:hypothetical protein KXD40_008408 [Peronospora effusa]|uniref:Transmembrane protein 198 n=1 Tax=Peronospora effusa TaxID=542832 RepID=A0A3M6VRR5_9STRA|nr:hypothetical protein DD238_003988 [Peronospora effusa]RQM10554.1 hypothetical protein DD237_005186 [Peronospora effusa]UIZ24490.1 hypothetical protein KXD40_008408 [Peronospora effusa]